LAFSTSETGCSRVLAPCVDEPVIGHLLGSWVLSTWSISSVPTYLWLGEGCFSIPDRFLPRTSSRTHAIAPSTPVASPEPPSVSREPSAVVGDPPSAVPSGDAVKSSALRATA
jgi:hypothetical protein